MEFQNVLYLEMMTKCGIKEHHLLSEYDARRFEHILFAAIRYTTRDKQSEEIKRLCGNWNWTSSGIFVKKLRSTLDHCWTTKGYSPSFYIPIIDKISTYIQNLQENIKSSYVGKIKYTHPDHSKITCPTICNVSSDEKEGDTMMKLENLQIFFVSATKDKVVLLTRRVVQNQLHDLILKTKFEDEIKNNLLQTSLSQPMPSIVIRYEIVLVPNHEIQTDDGGSFVFIPEDPHPAAQTGTSEMIRLFA